ncbi:DUF2855 family protein [Hyphobacterium sp. HN65]|uniref:DUF2855 family protein n=1 Tax=Hyphobacterium lacteum TaxID=3116575 RepID=A0ABU7LPE7_9PROT|nr:DUF2855 family protein [Hyphobacterium sp. HN65]MEE2525757.1 DUF2855 family protein [Hyphobacterium sp. HN65]
MSWALEINKADIREAQIREVPAQDLSDGQIRLAIDRFALTANNITYAAFGEVMRYWDFFPASLPDNGRLPVWGFARVAESKSSALGTGERIYGYFPAASELVVEPSGVSPTAFVDASPHRADLPAPYNRYVRCADDAGYDPALEAEQMVLQPLFLTGWLLARYVNEEAAFGANRIFLTSASSKTAIGMAKCLKDENRAGARLIGLTSPGSRTFVEGLGFYDEVVTYPEIPALHQGDPALIVDFAGDADINRALHTRLADDLKANIRVGGAHWEHSTPSGDLPGPRPAFFFAPDHVQRVIADLGPGGFQKAYGQSWNEFASGASGWLAFKDYSGAAASLEIYRKLIDGDAIARDGLTISV